MKHFLNLSNAGGNALAAMINDAQERKARRAGWPKGRADEDQPLAGHVLAMVFEKSSTRTRVSFDIAMRQLGGTALVLDGSTSQLGRGESLADTARVLGRMADAVMVRTDDHTKVEIVAENAGVPVINGLTDLSHPCQIVADLLTMIEERKALPGLRVCWLGDCNNVLNSIVEAAGLMKFGLSIGTPDGFLPDETMLHRARSEGAIISITSDAASAVRDCDVVMTDTWVSMGQSQAEKKVASMTPYRVDSNLMQLARDDAIFMHCLPAHVGEEVTQDVFEGEQSVVFAEAENRLHAQKSILLWSFGLLD